MFSLVKLSNAQSDVPLPTVTEIATNPDAAQPDVPQGDAPQAGVDEDFAPNLGNEEPPDTALDTGLPLDVLLTPFHWGRFSMLSVTAFEGYNSNIQFRQTPVGTTVTSFSSLALYSAQFAGWRVNLQYQPFVTISSGRTIDNFAATSLDLRTAHRLSGSWHWTLVERFRYSPSHSTQQAAGFLGTESAFLSSGRNVLVNGVAANLSDHYDTDSTLTFHANQNYTRLSSYLGTQSSDQLPVEQVVVFSAGVSWHHRLTLKDTISAEYVDRLQTLTGAANANVNSQNANIGWSHKLYPSFGISGSIGPAWSTDEGQQNAKTPSRTRVTLHGSLALAKQFKRGELVLAFARSNNFSGVISDSFHNRYDVTVRRQFNTRLSCSAAASYVQQQSSTARSTNGEQAAAELRYLLSHNWAFFTQVHYSKITGNEGIFAPEKSASAGVRWSWVPEKP